MAIKTGQSFDLNQPTLPDLLESIHAGEIQLPDFQRDFLWGPGQVKALLDTIQKKHPAGSLLLLTVSAEGSTPFGARPFKFTPDEAEQHRPRHLVLDGQQRLTACYAAIYNLGRRTYYLDLKRLHAVISDASDGGSVDIDELLILRPHDDQPDKRLFSSHHLPLSFLSNRDSLRDRLGAYKKNLRSADPDDPYLEFIERVSRATSIHSSNTSFLR